MSKFRQTIDEIQQFLNSPDQSEDAAIKGLAAEYKLACDETNSRLRKCRDLLEQGLRSQAIRLAEAEPNLLEVVAELDFVERDEWEEIAAQYGWERAYGLQVGIADQLNEAYESEEQLAPLLKQHRTLAWSRAPLTSRLKLMRRIAALDATTSFWREDINAFEQAALEELEQRMKGAASDRDAVAAGLIWNEFTGQPWSTSVPNRVRRRMEAGYAIYADALAIPELTKQLAQAVRDRAPERARDLLDRWNEVQARMASASDSWQPPAASRKAVDAAERFLRSVANQTAREDAYQQSLQQLHVAMLEGATPAAVAAYEQQVLAFGRGLPTEISSQLVQFRQRHRTETIKSLFLSGLIVAVVCIVLLMAFVIWLNSRRSSAPAASHSASVHDAAWALTTCLWQRPGNHYGDSP